MTVQAAPGTVLAVWTSASFASDMIRVEEALLGRPAVANHVVIVTHQDQLGRWMGIEGRPGGVGPADCTGYLGDTRTRGNYAQVQLLARAAGTAWPRQRDAFLASCARSLGIGYDWCGIAEDGLDALHLDDLSREIDPLWRWDPGQLPGHVVCSSLAAALYEIRGWRHPGTGHERNCSPADWWDFSDRQLWAQPARS
jgi:hypothetical protein